MGRIQTKTTSSPQRIAIFMPSLSAHHPELPKPWWKKYKMTIISITLQTIILGDIFLSFYFNPIPKEEDLLKYEIKILGIQEYQPHVHVRLNNDKEMMMEFPVVDTYKPRRFIYIDKEIQKSMIGCTGVVHGIFVSFSIQQRFKIWNMNCGKFSHDFNFFEKHYLLSKDSFFFFFYLSWFISVLWSFLVFISDRREK